MASSNLCSIKMDLHMIHKEFDQLCRFCLSSEECIPIFTEELELNERLIQLQNILQPKIDEHDGLPNRMCMTCLNCVEKFVEFESSCEKSYKMLRKASKLYGKIELEDGNEPENKFHPSIEVESKTDDLGTDCFDKPAVEYFDECTDNDVITTEHSKDSQTVIDETVNLPVAETESSAQDDAENPNEIITLTDEQQKMFDTAMEVKPSGILERGKRKFQLVECIYCRKVFPGRSNLKRHLRIHLNNTKNVEDLQTAETENTTEDDRETANESIKLTDEQQKMLNTAMAVKPTGYSSSGKRKVPLVECIYCKTVYHGRSSLKRHVRGHLSINVVQCTGCGKTFSDHSAHSTHQCKHTGKSFKCSECWKSYFNEIDLNKHIKMQHGERKYTCETCQKKFPTRYILNCHYRVHRSDRPYECKECGKRFKCKSGLSSHTLIHQKANKEPMPPVNCQLCVESFEQPTALLEHLISIHDDVLESIRSGTFECTYCDEGKFSDFLVSLNHMQTHYTSIVKVKYRRSLVSCGECGTTFKTRYAAMQHMSTHQANGCYSCFICEQNGQSILFKDLSQLNAHKKEAHKDRPK